MLSKFAWIHVLPILQLRSENALFEQLFTSGEQ